MPRLLLSLALLLATVMVAPVFTTHADEMPKFEQAPPPDAPFNRPCLSVDVWLETMINPASARLLYLGRDVDGTTDVIMMTPDGSIGIFNIAADGIKVCVLAFTEGTWDKKLLGMLFFDGKPGVAI